jgi:hypothetical protein
MKFKVPHFAGLFISAVLFSGAAGADYVLGIQVRNCAYYLKQLDVAVMCYRNDHDDKFPSPRDLQEDVYLVAPNPRSCTFCPAGGAYEFLIPPQTKFDDQRRSGGAMNIPLSQRPMLRCPIHGHTVMEDGHLEKCHDLAGADTVSEGHARCAAGLKVLGVFLRMYVGNTGRMPSAYDLVAEKYVAADTGVFVCLQGGRYEFLIRSGERVSAGVPVLRCQLHGNVLSFDGDVRYEGKTKEKK